MTVGPFTRKTDLVDLVRAQDINELQIACEDLQDQILSHTHDASKITSGTLSTDRFSAYNDLVAENYIGLGSAQIPTNAHRAIGIMAKLDIPQSIPNTTWTKVAINSLIREVKPSTVDSQWDPVNNRFIVRVSGWYLLTGSVSYSMNSTGVRLVAIAVNGSRDNVMGQVDGVSGYDARVACATIAYLSVNDTVELHTFQNSGTGLDLSLSIYSPSLNHLKMVLLFPG